MSALPWILGGGAVALGAYLWTRRDKDSAGDDTGPLPGRWVWPVGIWMGRKPEISDGFQGTRRSSSGEAIRHGGVDIMYRRIASDRWPAGSTNGTRQYVMPPHRAALAASDGLIWSASYTPRGWTVVIDHAPRKLATYYTHLSQLLVVPKQTVRVGQPIGIIGADPLDVARLAHLLCGAAHKRCNAERSLCRAVGARPRFCGGSSRSATHNASTAEVFEPGEQISRREAVARHLRQRRRHGRYGGLLHPKVDLYVSVCGRELGVAEPRGDRGDVDGGQQKMHGRGVSQHVRRYGFRVTCRDLRASDQSAKDVGDAGAAQSITSGVEKQRGVLIAGAALIEPRLDRSDSARPEWTRALPSALADDCYVRNRVEGDVAHVQIDEFLDAQARVVQHEYKCSISKAVARVRCLDDAGHLVFIEVAHLDVFGASQVLPSRPVDGVRSRLIDGHRATAA